MSNKRSDINTAVGLKIVLQNPSNPNVDMMITAADFISSLGLATDPELGLYLLITGGTMTGPIIMSDNIPIQNEGLNNAFTIDDGNGDTILQNESAVFINAQTKFEANLIDGDMKFAMDSALDKFDLITIGGLSTYIDGGVDTFGINTAGGVSFSVEGGVDRVMVTTSTGLATEITGAAFYLYTNSNAFITLIENTDILTLGSGAGVISASPTEIKIELEGAGVFTIKDLPVYANNAAALGGGLVAENVYKTATGELRIVV